MKSLLIRRNASSVQVLSHWNRRTWQEITVLKARIEVLEKKTQTDTGGDNPFAPEGDPWETEIVTNKLAIGWAFVGGFIVGSILWIILLWG